MRGLAHTESFEVPLHEPGAHPAGIRCRSYSGIQKYCLTTCHPERSAALRLRSGQTPRNAVEGSTRYRRPRIGVDPSTPLRCAQDDNHLANRSRNPQRASEEPETLHFWMAHPSRFLICRRSMRRDRCSPMSGSRGRDSSQCRGDGRQVLRNDDITSYP
jgi:hypothetical protein